MSTNRELVLRQFSEPLKKSIVCEIESGRLSQMEAARNYGTSRSSIQKWLKQHGKLRKSVKIVEVVMSDSKEKILELQQALAESQLKLRIYEKMIELAGKEYKIDLKKNYGTQASELLKGKEVASK